MIVDETVYLWHRKVISFAQQFSDHYWKTSRKHLNLAFNLNVLKGFIPIFDSYAINVAKDMEANLDGREFDLLFPLAQLATRTVAGADQPNLGYSSLHRHGPRRGPAWCLSPAR